MSGNLRVLKWSLLPASMYCLSVVAAHMLGAKVPILFVYFNVPSNAYQDRIIASGLRTKLLRRGRLVPAVAIRAGL